MDDAMPILQQYEVPEDELADYESSGGGSTENEPSTDEIVEQLEAGDEVEVEVTGNQLEAKTTAQQPMFEQENNTHQDSMTFIPSGTYAEAIAPALPAPAGGLTVTDGITSSLASFRCTNGGGSPKGMVAPPSIVDSHAVQDEATPHLSGGAVIVAGDYGTSSDELTKGGMEKRGKEGGGMNESEADGDETLIENDDRNDTAGGDQTLVDDTAETRKQDRDTMQNETVQVDENFTGSQPDVQVAGAPTSLCPVSPSSSSQGGEKIDVSREMLPRSRRAHCHIAKLLTTVLPISGRTSARDRSLWRMLWRMLGSTFRLTFNNSRTDCRKAYQ